MSSQDTTLLFEHETTVEYPKAALGYTLITLRIVIGWVFFYSGITKVLDPNWTAAGYLQNAVSASNPFVDIWTIMAEAPLVDMLVQWGLTLTGLGLILGIFVRWNTFWAGVMMLLFWASSLPLDNGIIVDKHLVYLLVLAVLSVSGAGRIAGLDALLERTTVVRNNSLWQYLLG